jgi:AcrR family transcriptional regulator
MKDKILDSAINLFNAQGVNNTSFRDIASDLEVSDGHVRYYFKTKEILLLCAFERLDAEILAETNGIQPHSDLRELLLVQLQKAFTIMVRYRFLFYESPTVLNQFPALQKAYKQLLLDRKTLFLSVFQELIKIGFFSASFTPGKQEKVFYALFVFSDSWIRYYFIMNNQAPNDEVIAFHSELAFGMLEAYLTA